MKKRKITYQMHSIMLALFTALSLLVVPLAPLAALGGTSSKFASVAAASDANLLADLYNNLFAAQPAAAQAPTSCGPGPTPTVLVTNTNDSGPGSLRDALTALPHGSVVGFNIPTSDPGYSATGGPNGSYWTISPVDSFPFIAGDNITIDGGDLKIVLDSTNFSPSTLFNQAFMLSGDNTTIRGMVIQNFPFRVIQNYPPSTGHVFQCNHIINNSQNAISMRNATVLIGTDGDGVNDANEGNLLSGNALGVSLRANSDSVIAGNYIGVNAAGTSAMPNITGVAVTSNGPSPSNDVRVGTNGDGTSDALERNIISGNTASGIGIGGASDTIVAGNYIGTDVNGTSAIPNSVNGVNVFGASDGTRIGSNGDGTNDVVEANVISGNGDNGVLVRGTTSAGNIFMDSDTIIRGNQIGESVTQQPLANGGDGIYLQYTANTVIDDNRLNNSGRNGIYVRGAEAIVSNNTIENNSESGIYVTASFGQTPTIDDVGSAEDEATAPNDVISSVDLSGNNTIADNCSAPSGTYVGCAGILGDDDSVDPDANDNGVSLAAANTINTNTGQPDVAQYWRGAVEVVDGATAVTNPNPVTVNSSNGGPSYTLNITATASADLNSTTLVGSSAVFTTTDVTTWDSFLQFDISEAGVATSYVPQDDGGSGTYSYDANASTNPTDTGLGYTAEGIDSTRNISYTTANPASFTLSRYQIFEVFQTPPPADLVTSIGQPSPQFTEGEESIVPITVTNNGAGPATGTITATMTLPANTSAPASFTDNGWSCTTSSQTVTCTMPDVIAAGGGSSTVNVPVTPGSGSEGTTPGPFTGTSSTPGEINTGNNPAAPMTPSSPVQPPLLPDLVTSIGQPSSQLIEEVASNIPVTVTNNGIAPTSGPVTATMTLPTNTSAPTSFSDNGWSCSTSGQTVTCTTPTILTAGGGSNTVNVPVTPGVGTAGTTPTFNATSSTPSETATGNNPAAPMTPSSAILPAGTDLIAPAPPEIDPVDDTQTTITGDSEPGATIDLTDGSNPIVCTNAPVVADAAGEWSCTIAAPRAANSGINATATDPDGNVSQPGSTTVLGNASGQSDPPTVDPVYVGDPVIRGTAVPSATIDLSLLTPAPAFSAITCSNAPVIADADGNWSCTVSSTAPAVSDRVLATATEPSKTTSPFAGTVVVDPAVTSPPAPQVDPTSGSVVTGTTIPDGEIDVVDPATGNVLCSTIADGAGNFSCSPLSPVPSPGDPLNVTVTDPTGGGTSNPTTVVVDTPTDNVAPSAPEIDPIDDTQTEITGEGEPGATIDLTGSPTGVTCTNAPVVADAAGEWSCTITTPLPAGTVVEATATDPAGNTSEPASTTVSDVPGESNAPTIDPVMSGDPTIDGTAGPGATIDLSSSSPAVTCSNAPVVADANGDWSCTPTTPPSTDDVISATATEPGKTVSPPATTTVTDPAVTAPPPPTVDPTTGEPVTGITIPGGVIEVIDPTTGNVLCTTTADGSGNFSCSPVSPVPSPGELLNVTVTDPTGGGTSNPATVVVQSASVSIPIKLFLQGAYDSTAGIMRDDLRTLNDFPLTSPYGDGATISLFAPPSALLSVRASTIITSDPGPPIVVVPPVLSTSGNDAIVDWVLVELRDSGDNTSVVATIAGLVQRDGDVVAASDGTSSLSFSVAAGNYYVAVHHRNHLSVMTDSTVAVSASTAAVDFTTMSNANSFGTNSQTTPLGQSSPQLMWGGDASGDNKVIGAGPGTDIVPIRTAVLTASGNNPGGTPNSNYVVAGYANTDANMDGDTIAAGGGNEISTIILTNTFLHPANLVSQNSNFVIQGQLPELLP